MSIRIPADLSNVGYDVLGNPLTNPAGTASNNAGCKFVQTSQAVLDRTEGFWVDGANTAIRRDHADWLLRPNGEQCQVDQWQKLGAGNVCCVTKSSLFSLGTNFTEDEKNDAIDWSNDALLCGAGWVDYVQLLVGNTDGETLTDYLSFIASKPAVVDVPCALFNGTNQYLQAALNPTKDDKFELHGRFVEVASTYQLNGTHDGANRLYFGAHDGDWYLGYGEASGRGSAADTDPHWFRMEGGKLFLDGSTTHVADQSGNTFNGDVSTPFFIGARSDDDGDPVLFANMEVYEVRINDVQIAVYEEGAGLPYNVQTGQRPASDNPPTWTTTDHKGKCYALDRGFAHVALVEEIPEIPAQPPAEAVFYTNDIDGSGANTLVRAADYNGYKCYCVDPLGVPLGPNGGNMFLLVRDWDYWGGGEEPLWMIIDYDMTGYAWVNGYMNPNELPYTDSGWEHIPLLHPGEPSSNDIMNSWDEETEGTPLVPAVPEVPAHRCPARAAEDGYAANGDPLTNPAGTVSNDAGCKFVQTDATVLARGAGFWVDGSHGAERVGHADWIVRENGADDQVDRWEKLGAGNVCCVVASRLYEEGAIAAFSEAEIAQIIAWSNNAIGCGAGWTT